MIRKKNISEEFIELNVSGTQSAATDKVARLIPFDCQIKAIYAKLGTAGVTGSQIIDVNKNGTTIFANAVKLTFATTAVACTYDTLTANPTLLSKGDIITVDVDSVHSGTAAVNLVIILTVIRQKSGPKRNLVETNTIGVDAE